MKRKVLVVSLVIILFAIMIVGGTLAWFTDTEEVVNVFHLGSVKVRQNEEFVQNSQLIPIIPNDTATPTDDRNFVPKVVTISNVGGNPAYVQTFVAIPAALDQEKKLDEGLLRIYRDVQGDWQVIDGDAAAHGVQPTGAVEIQGMPYHVYKFVNSQCLSGGQTTGAVMEGVYIDAAADMNIYKEDDGNITAAYFLWDGKEITEWNAANMQLDVYVVTQAMQSEEFSDAEAALKAGFGDGIPEFAVD